MDLSINVLPLIIGAVFNMVLGALWYSPVLFAKPWMKEAEITSEYIEVSKGKMGKVYIFTTIMAFITCYIIGILIINMNITSIIEGLFLAFLVWIGTNLPSVIKNWGFENRTIKLGIINHGYDLLVYLVVAILYIVL